MLEVVDRRKIVGRLLGEREEQGEFKRRSASKVCPLEPKQPVRARSNILIG
jgi:hypothetical protein